MPASWAPSTTKIFMTSATRQVLPRDALILAPMATLSHRGAREIISSFGACDIFFTEMANAAAIVSGNRFEEYYLDTLPHPEKTVLQLVGGDEQEILTAADFIRGRFFSGAAEPIFGIDLNCGCSAPEIIRGGGGAAWLRKPSALLELAARLRERLPDCNLSAKLRLGESDDPQALLFLGRGFESAGFDFITLHPRLRSDKYGRPPRWERVALLAAELSIPVIGNGDVDGYEVWRSRKQQSGCAGVMIGRAAMRMPWIFKLLRARDADSSAIVSVDLEEIARRFIEALILRQPPEFHKSRARRFFYYLAENLRFGNRIKYRTQAGESPEECLDIFLEYFLDSPYERVMRFGGAGANEALLP